MDLITQLPAPDRDTRLALNKNFAVLEVEDEKDDARLNREIQDRQAADDKEASARHGEDVNLQSQIDAIIQQLDKNEKNITDLQTRMKTAEDHIKKLDDIIFGTEYINDTDEIPLDDSMRPITDAELNDTKVISDDDAEVDISNDHVVLTHELN